MNRAKQAVNYAAALAEKYPKPETLASSRLAINDYMKAVDLYTNAVRKYEDASVANGNAVNKYHESCIRYERSKKSR